MEKNKKKIDRDELEDCFTDEELEEMDEFLEKIVLDAEEKIRKRNSDPNAQPIKSSILSEDGESVIIREVSFYLPKKKN